ncbi:MAG: UvrB/UvrC motif-containing protein [Candidatus Latescibacterota bacterium]
MQHDISLILTGWEYKPGELKVRRVDGGDGRSKVQVRMDLGLLQLEWTGRPDAARPHGYPSLLDYHQAERARWEGQSQGTPYRLSSQDCWELSQEAAKYYWRRVSFFELREYARAEEDALHNLGILDLCYECAEEEEDRRMAETHRPFVLAHRYQARALACLNQRDFDGTLREIRAGICEIERFLQEVGRGADSDGSPELTFLRQWETEVQNSRPLSRSERLRADLEDAVAHEEFERAALLRDRLQRLGGEGP